MAGVFCGEAARSAPLAAAPAGYPQLNLPSIDAAQQGFDTSFPDTLQGEPETCGNADRHLKSLEEWRKTQLEDMRKKLEAFDAEVQRYDQSIERQKAQRAISDADYSAWQQEMVRNRQLTSRDGPWLTLYRSWANSMRQEIGHWTAVRRANDCD